MKVWNGADPFASSSLQEFFRDGESVYSFCLPKECEEKVLAGLPTTPNAMLALKVHLFVSEHRRVGCHHYFRHPQFLVVEYIRGGNLFFRQDDRCYLLEPGDVYLMRPNAVSEIITGPAGFCDKASISVEGPLLLSAMETLGLNSIDVVTPHDKCRKIEKCFERIEQGLEEQNGCRVEYLSGLCLELLQTVANWDAPEEENTEMAAIISCMERNIGRKFSMPELAAELGMSASTLSRRCRQLGNVTPVQLMTRLRMNRAATMLLEDKTRVNEIAASLGYDNALNFSTAFKSFFGISPRSYRKKNLLYHSNP